MLRIRLGMRASPRLAHTAPALTPTLSRKRARELGASPIGRVHRNISGDFALPPRAVLQKPILVVE